MCGLSPARRQQAAQRRGSFRVAALDADTEGKAITWNRREIPRAHPRMIAVLGVGLSRTLLVNALKDEQLPPILSNTPLAT